MGTDNASSIRRISPLVPHSKQVHTLLPECGLKQIPLNLLWLSAYKLVSVKAQPYSYDSPNQMLP